MPRRILAYFVDFYAWALASVMVESLFIDLNDPQANPTGLGFLVGWVAMSALVASTGRTPGKLLVGGRLVSTANPDGEVSFGIAMWRYAVASVVSFLLISQLSALGNDERRTLHDRWTKTRVVRTR
ncbi:MAG: RDD family protein [Actinomycetota bacterium]